MRLIETTEIERWASSRSAQSPFPRLVKDLISAVIEPVKLRFPSGDAIWLPGFDGVLTSSEHHRFVPYGESVWELGTEPDCKGKANKDYKKRSQKRVQRREKGDATQQRNRKKLTFVFVTPRVWPNKHDQETAWKEDDIWQDVVIIDGVDLKEWLEIAPAVALQFAAELRSVPEQGLQTPEQAWEEWSHLTKPAASEELVVIGRKE